MKKKLSLLLAIILVLGMTSSAFAGVLSTSASRDLTISGTQVACTCSARESGSYLTITMKLYQDGRVVETWYDSGQDRVSLSETYSGRSGSTYKLSVTYTVDGTRYNMPTITKACP